MFRFAVEIALVVFRENFGMVSRALPGVLEEYFGTVSGMIREHFGISKIFLKVRGVM